MHDLANQGGVSDDSLIDFVICGIPDAAINKSVLYGTTYIPELKVNLELYRRMQERLVAEAMTRTIMKRVPTAPTPGGLAV